MPSEYSEKEQELITKLGFSKEMKYMKPSILYKKMVEDAFINNKQGKDIETLRIIYKTFLDPNNITFRLTQEWDDLISF